MKKNHLRKRLQLVLFYGILRFLPKSYEFGGIIARRLRARSCSVIFESCDSTSNIEQGCYFGNGSGIALGRRSSIGVNSKLRGKISIGDDVMMGPNVLILTINHAFSDITRPMIEQGNQGINEVTISDDVWIGERAIILPGVSLGKGCIVGAGSVVTKSFPDYSVIAGNPARLIRNRIDKEG